MLQVADSEEQCAALQAQLKGSEARLSEALQLRAAALSEQAGAQVWLCNYHVAVGASRLGCLSHTVLIISRSLVPSFLDTIKMQVR